MKINLGAQCDDFYTSSRLYLKLDLNLDREAIMHFFDRIRREYPSMRKFRRRDDGSLVLEEADPESREGESRRWVRLEPGALRFGYFSPPDRPDWKSFGHFLLEQAPHHLTISELDIDHLETLYGFDMEYSGNHDQLVAETLYPEHPLASFLLGDEAVHAIDCQPYVGISLSRSCDLQAYIEVKSRTSSFEVRTGEYEAQLLSVFLTVRRYWGFQESAGLVPTFDELNHHAEDLAVRRVVPLVVNPLALAIASRP